ncbi:OmpA family protein (plasmid) [Tolypothrix sp. PCC 7910]|uniref:phosphate ABC transporter substrate-binding/OmpA family protein n=1 Tax=Tolypothrix sp. PCC 7910 TaxID=2099387 RepID=UPI0014278C3F|nr:phosphate ABC transporter substrate-binding/OmpA family protein [Tolypothrix sp. PCC 7910]QIR41884.1 OmpA family protein [Tolypothrix sp. PCC 7910]
MNKLEPEVTVNLCGSTTLGERFAPRFIEAIAQKNHAISIESKAQLANTKGIYTMVDAEFIVMPNKETNNFSQGLSRVRFIIDAQGTEDGFKKLISKKCDIAMASTRATKKSQEMEKFPGTTIGKDAIVIITNTKEDQLSSNEIKDIFEGKKDSWDVFCREESGTTEELKIDLKIDNFSNCNFVNNNSQMLEKVADKNSKKTIGYLSYSFLSNLIQEVGKDFYIVKVDGISPFLTWKRNPSTNTDIKVDFKFINDKYPLQRRLYLYTQTQFINDKLEKIVDSMVRQFAPSEDGQSILQSVGFVSTASESLLINDGLTITDPTEMLSNLKDIYDYIYHNRITYPPAYTVFLPQNGDIPEQEEKNKLTDWWFEIRKQRPEKTLVLIGHASPKGVSSRYNLGLSLERANQIKNILQEKSPSNMSAYALGWDYPIFTEIEKNRRVEIYFLSTLQEIDNKLKSDKTPKN